MLYMVFDVESVGLHGEGYAVGFVVVDDEGNTHDEGLYSCNPNVAAGNQEGYKWIEKHAPPLPETHKAPWLVRAAFWRKWCEWRNQGAILVADCAWPVEARFLHACVGDDLYSRGYSGPYPLHDLASMLLAKGFDPVKSHSRHANETPEHNPLADARHSARILLGCLSGAIEV